MFVFDDECVSLRIHAHVHVFTFMNCNKHNLYIAINIKDDIDPDGGNIEKLLTAQRVNAEFHVHPCLTSVNVITVKE